MRTESSMLPTASRKVARKDSVESFRDKWLRRLFRLGVLIKGVDGVLETIGGISFLLMSRSALNGIVMGLTRPELMEDPDDLIANSLRHAFGHLSASGKLYGGIYLLVHGAVKIFLVVCLLRGRLWSFPTAILVLIGFIGYQIYRINLQFSWLILALTALDALIVLLIWHEYVYLKHRRDLLK